MRYILIVILSGIFIFSCSKPQDDLLVLRNYLVGSFTNQEQAQKDSSFDDISLEMAPIWRDRTDGYWLYVEQATARDLEKPYRQRVYRLTQESDSVFLSTVYTLPQPLRFAGAWKEKEPLQSLTPDSLTERDGCGIILHKYGDDMFVGSTEGLACNSDLKGAIYATSIVIVSKDQLYSWDRGYDISGKQVWGSEKGGYIFKKTGTMGRQ